jgi:hypothetical protein
VALPQSYVDKNNNLAARQIVLAGHRLAKTIEMIFGGKTTEEALFADYSLEENRFLQ